MVVSAFPPSVEMGAQACWQIARNLPRYGWTPIVLTMEEQHTEYSGGQAGFEPGFPVVRTGTLPHPVSLLRRVRAAQKAGGGEAAQVKQVARGELVGRRGWLRRTVLTGLNVPDTLTGWIPPAVLAGRRLLRRSNVACLFSSGPAWSSHLAALALARLTGLPWVAHFRDPWSQGQGSIAPDEPRWAVRMNARLERAVVRRAARVICVTEQHANVLRRHYVSCASEKFVTISNGYDGAEWEQLERELGAAGTGARDDCFVITYAGALYVGRSPLLVLEALMRLAQVGDIPADRVRLDLILYDGVRHLPDGRDMMEVAREMGLGGSLRIQGPFRRDETLRRLLESDLLLLLGNNVTMQIPGKLYEYLRTGRPILALAPSGAQTELLRATGGAWIVEPDDVNGAVAAIRDAYQRWLSGQPGPKADPRLVSSFDRRVLVRRFAEELDAAVSRTVRSRGGRQRPIPGRK
jgi:glycosyltransferase involved in cell wall biosynthesis